MQKIDKLFAWLSLRAAMLMEKVEKGELTFREAQFKLLYYMHDDHQISETMVNDAGEVLNRVGPASFLPVVPRAFRFNVGDRVGFLGPYYETVLEFAGAGEFVDARDGDVFEGSLEKELRFLPCPFSECKGVLR